MFKYLINMKKLMFKYLKNERGDGNILAFIILSPIFLWIFLYIIMGGSFLLEINQMTAIVNKSLDEALVEGQYSTDLQEHLRQELIDSGFTEDSLEITITPTAAGDGSNSTYVTRGNLIEVKVVYKKPHRFYYTNLKVGGESKYWIGTKIQGMSEQW